MPDDAPETSPYMWPITLVVVAAIGAATVIVPKFAPQPTPVIPGPAPVVPAGNLASLVPEAESRAKLAQFFGDFAAVVRDEKCPLKSTGQFREAYRAAVPLMQSAGRLPDVKAIDAPISERLTIAMGGLDDKPLTDTTRSLLAGTLDSVAAEFK